MQRDFSWWVMDRLGGITHHRAMGNCLAYYREKAGYTQEALAELAGTSAASISRIEADDQNYTRDLLRSICGFLGISLAQAVAETVPSEEEFRLVTLFRSLNTVEQTRLLRVVATVFDSASDGEHTPFDPTAPQLTVRSR